mmetsp:Transcript_69560/g.166832  ORF Transcript_69560/g.166832 Transcript_69560/m.166832 type:complete len:917 (-) Transcript_69560:151-2901(-)|eukprot:CAMPEP_0178388590 /NCGR_PEP_ID=MMETSP0689_2-20121128/9674_1 /TAXON_ID=160604 /ORGANISM="Amphidinium massartii, Strain CS-259" /LENGTH=916 /DNA_ID=CAMNT_0020009003 /DNA_START=90 /DNA_END=2840 /DNA_ORIENTATION=-
MAKVTPMEMIPSSDTTNSRQLSGRLPTNLDHSTSLRLSNNDQSQKLTPTYSEKSLRVSSMMVNRFSDPNGGGSASLPATAMAAARHRARRVMERTGWYDSPLASSMRRFLRGRVFTLIAMVALFAALFFPDIWVLAQVPSNEELDALLFIVLLIFAFEWIALVLTDASYIFGFFFWMDLVGTCSMLADISFLLGASATKPVRVQLGGGSTENIIVVRAARAAKLGARAGRLSRVLKILRFLPFLNWSNEKDAKKVKMAKVISNQLTNVVSTRVAFLTICMVVVIPVFSLFTYPEVDDSMYAWAELLARSANDAGADAANAALYTRLRTETQRFADFYDDLVYGPFRACLGQKADLGFFECESQAYDLSFSTRFSEPGRRSSIRIVNFHNQIEAWFDFSTQSQHEAAMGIGLVLFVILSMCSFGILMSSSITVIALRPLERMLATVRERCAQIFKYTSDLEEDAGDDEDEEDYDDMEQAGEFVLLEKVVVKLAAIANLSTKAELEVKEGMDEDDIMKLNWMQGTQVQTPATGAKALNKGEGEDSQTITKSMNVMSLSNKTLPKEIVDALDTPHFNSLDIGKEQKIAVSMYLVISNEGSAAWVQANVEEASLKRFVQAVEANYLPNPFHNFAHAVDVAYSCARYMRMIGAADFLSETTQLWLIIGALAHDLGHTGVNNQYLIESSHELAIKYNDRSPLENYHCSKLFEILSQPEANVFGGADRDLYKEIRKGLINAILHTDVTKHNEMVKELSLMYQMNSEPFDSGQPASAITGSATSVQLIVNMLLHGADISNPMKPWTVCERLAHLCLDEFFAQGDLEKEAGLPVQMLNDRDKVNRPNSQVGFIEFVIAPLVEASIRLFPPLDELADHLAGNIKRWCDIWQEQTVPPPPAETIAKTTARVQRVVERCKSVMRGADS